MTRVAFRMKVKSGCETEYQKRHDEIWPELAALLREQGISDYSIFLDEETGALFAVQKVDGNNGSQDLAENPIVQKWWRYMADIMDVNDDKSPVAIPLREVFYLE